MESDPMIKSNPTIRNNVVPPNKSDGRKIRGLEIAKARESQIT
jgi:hypothetical protein